MRVGGGQEQWGGLNMIKIVYRYVCKCHNETHDYICLISANKNLRERARENKP